MPRHSRNEAALRRMVDAAWDSDAMDWKLACGLYSVQNRGLRRENHRLLADNQELVMALVGTPSAGDVRRVVRAYARDRYAAAGRWLNAHPVVMGLAFAFVLITLAGLCGGDPR